MSNDTLWETLNAREREIEGLEDEVKALRKDAERYRLFRTLGCVDWDAIYARLPAVEYYTQPSEGDQLDLLLDAALAAGRESK